MQKKSLRLPKPANILLGILLPKMDLPNLLGDYTEIYNRIAFAQGKTSANIWLFKQIFRSIPRYLGDQVYWRTIMLKNYLKITLRNFKRHKGYTFINFAGLTIGLAVTLSIAFYVMDDLKDPPRCRPDLPGLVCRGQEGHKELHHSRSPPSRFQTGNPGSGIRNPGGLWRQATDRPPGNRLPHR